MVGVAVNVTCVPLQTVVADAAILTAGVTEFVIVMVTSFEVAVEVETQLAFDVMTLLTTSLLAKDAFEYVALLLPTLLPFNFH